MTRKNPLTVSVSREPYTSSRFGYPFRAAEAQNSEAELRPGTLATTQIHAAQ
jgi:hypothetical protein